MREEGIDVMAVTSGSDAWGRARISPISEVSANASKINDMFKQTKRERLANSTLNLDSMRLKRSQRRSNQSAIE